MCSFPAATMASKKRKLSFATGPKRVNDKLIVNYVKAATAATQSTVLYSSANNAVTIDRVIFTGNVQGNHASTEVTTNVGFIVVHHRPNDVTVNQSVTHGIQSWPDDKAVLYQGLWRVCERSTASGYRVEFDVKGMRKLAIGESIRCYLMSQLTLDIVFDGCFTIFGKLA